MTKIEKANTKTVPITRDHIYKSFQFHNAMLIFNNYLQN